MPEPEHSKVEPDFLKRKFGPLSFLGWVGVLAGCGVVYYLYSRYEADKTASTAAASPGTGSDTGDTGTSGTTDTITAGTYATTSSWLTAAVEALIGNNVDGADAYNWANDFINGHCVSSKGYSALSTIIGSVGSPPGVSTTLSVCPDKPSAKQKTLDSELAAARTALATKTAARSSAGVTLAAYEKELAAAGANVTKANAARNAAGTTVTANANAVAGLRANMVKNPGQAAKLEPALEAAEAKLTASQNAENAAQAHLANTRSVETGARSKVTAQQTVVKDAQAALTTANNLVANLLKQLAAL